MLIFLQKSCKWPRKTKTLNSRISDALENFRTTGFLSIISRENRFTFLNASIIKILEIDKELLTEEPALILHSIPAEDREYVSFLYNDCW